MMACDELDCGDVISVCVLVTVLVPVTPNCSPSPASNDEMEDTQLDPESPKGLSGVSEGVSEDVDETAGVVVLAYCRLICLKGWKPGRSPYWRAGAASAVVKGP